MKFTYAKLSIIVYLLIAAIFSVKANLVGPFNYDLYLPNGVENYNIQGATWNAGNGYAYLITGTDSYFQSGPPSSQPYGTVDFQTLTHVLRVFPVSLPAKCPETSMLSKNYSCYGTDTGICRSIYRTETAINSLMNPLNYNAVSRHRLIDTRAINTYTLAAPKPFFSLGAGNVAGTGRNFRGYSNACPSTLPLPLPPRGGDEGIDDGIDD